MKKSRPSPRRRARQFAMQAMFQRQFNETSAQELIDHFLEEHNAHIADVDYFRSLVNGTVQHLDELDEKIKPHLDRDISELSPVELAILRVAVYEFQFCLDVPYKVVINEALEIAKRYGSSEGHRFVNGVLDALAPQLRAIEKSQ